MSVMEKRLQLLLDRTRYDRVAAEAQRSGRSVAAVIREAIDIRFEDDDLARREAARDLLARLDDRSDERPEPEWAETKAAMEQELVDALERVDEREQA